MSFELTSENYYSDIANYEYMSVSQFKDFAGTYGKVGCGELRSNFAKAERAIARSMRDPLFQEYMSGEKQVIMTGELFGAKWKIKMDSYHPGKAIVDLKYMQSLTKFGYVPDIGYLDFVRYWGYDVQGAIYQEIVRQNTGKKLPFYIAGISKEEAIDIEVIYIHDNYLHEALRRVETCMPRILEVKSGKVKPERCEQCLWCRDTKVLRGAIGIGDLTASL